MSTFGESHILVNSQAAVDKRMRNNIMLTVLSSEKNQSCIYYLRERHHFPLHSIAFVLCPLRNWIYSASYLALALLVHLKHSSIDGGKCLSTSNE